MYLGNKYAKHAVKACTWISRRMMEKEYAKAIAPRACRLLHSFCVPVTVPALVSVPMLMPVRLPLKLLFPEKMQAFYTIAGILLRLIIEGEDGFISIFVPATFPIPSPRPAVEYVNDIIAATMESHHT